MSNIKTRESVKDIKVLDKAAVASERMKTALVRSKDQVENLMDDGQVSPSEYAEDKIRYIVFIHVHFQPHSPIISLTIRSAILTDPTRISILKISSPI